MNPAIWVLQLNNVVDKAIALKESVQLIDAFAIQ